MGRRPESLHPHLATSEGARLLRELLTTKSRVAIARRLGVDESCVRHWAREVRKPDPDNARRLRELFGIPEVAWFRAPDVDAYAVDDPETTRRAGSGRPVRQRAKGKALKRDGGPPTTTRRR